MVNCIGSLKERITRANMRMVKAYFKSIMPEFYSANMDDFELLVVVTLVLQGGFISYPIYKEILK